MTEPYLTIAEIEKKYRDLWVLIADTRHDRRHRLLGGHVVLSHPDKAEFERLWMEWDDATGRQHNLAMLYMGSFPVEPLLPVDAEPGAA
jgi:hypothetical protein